MDKFDEHEVCPACGNDPVESGLKWKPKFVQRNPRDAIFRISTGEEVPPGGVVPNDDYRRETVFDDAHLLVSCGQCKFQLKRACLNAV